MNIPISDRLLACCRFITPGDRVADIGCDHGYLGIYLLKNGIASFVIASDINPGPLKSAMNNSEKFDVRDKMEFHLSDGTQNIPRGFDTLVCAGMGADTMISILQNAPWLKDRKYKLVLQCQSKTAQLRKFLHDNGWQALNEIVLQDGRFLYTVMHLQWNPENNPKDVGSFYFPYSLLDTCNEYTLRYYRQTVNKLKICVNARGENAAAEEAAALRDLIKLSESYPFLKEEIL